MPGSAVATVFDELLSTFRSFLGAFGREPVRGFSAEIDWRMPARKLGARGLACLAHLGRAARIAGEEARPLARLLDARCHEFRWGQTYTSADFGQRRHHV